MVFPLAVDDVEHDVTLVGTQAVGAGRLFLGLVACNGLSPDLFLDLVGVGYMASSGLAMLVSAFRKSREMRVVFGICGLSPIVRQSVEVTALHEILPIFSDVNDALRRMN